MRQWKTKKGWIIFAIVTIYSLIGQPILNYTSPTKGDANVSTVNFTADITYGDYPLVVSFKSNVSDTEEASFLWSFGDGVNSRLRSPTHAYTRPGQYNVELSVKTNSPSNLYLKKENFITVVDDPSGTLYYVAPNGSNNNDGGSNNPWRDIWYGAEQLAPGDTLVVRGGYYRLTDDYDEGFVVKPNSGSVSGSWVKIRAALNEIVVLKGSKYVENGNYIGIDLTDAHYVAIQGIEIDGEGPSERNAHIRLGIEYANCHHIALVEMNVHHISEEGIKGHSAHHMLMEQVIITYSCYSAFDCGINDQPEYGVDEFTIRECNFSYSGKGGWNEPQERADGVACEISNGVMYIEYSEALNNLGDGWDCKLKTVYIYNCITGNNLNNIKVWQNAVIENCIAYNLEDDTDWDSIFFDGGTPDSRIVFCNNIIYNGKNYALAAGYDYPGVTSYITFYNNIIVGSDGPVFFQTGLVVEEDYNIFYQNGNGENSLEIDGRSYSDSEINQGLAGAHDLAYDPMFINPESGNFHLQEHSPTKNAGADFIIGTGATHIVSDFDLDDHSKENQKDIGPYEYLEGKITTTEMPSTSNISFNIVEEGLVSFFLDMAVVISLMIVLFVRKRRTIT